MDDMHTETFIRTGTYPFLASNEPREVSYVTLVKSQIWEPTGNINLDKGQDKTYVPACVDKPKEKEANSSSFYFCSVQAFGG